MSEGYKFINKKPWAKSVIKHPFFCPHCQQISSNLDDKYFDEYGVCQTCYTIHIDSREKPVIDVEYYRKRVREQGY